MSSEIKLKPFLCLFSAHFRLVTSIPLPLFLQCKARIITGPTLLGYGRKNVKHV